MNEKLEQLLKEVPNSQTSQNPKLYIRFANPLTGWSWYITEYNPETSVCFGYIKAFENEWGYFKIEDLGIMGCLLDTKFKACTFNEFIKGRKVE